MSKQTSTRIAAVILVTAPFSCTSPPDRRAMRGADIETGGHWVQDARLREVMADLDRQVAVSWPQETQEEYMSTTSVSAARQLEEACWLADALAAGADKIRSTLEGSDLNDADRKEFLTHVDELRFRAERLQKSAEQADVVAMRRVLDSIDHTCNSCHNRFRAVAGPLHR